MDLPPSVAGFRAHYQATEVGRWYHGGLHFLLTSAGSLVGIGLAISQVAAPGALELLTVPATFLFANLVEYRAHKGPMHHPTPPLQVIHKRHALQHHHYYTHETMSLRSHRDLHMVLFPPQMLLFFLGLIATPVGAALFVLLSPNVGWLYVATALGYFLSYEWLHLSYHLPEDSLVGRLPFMGALRRHHTVHHDLRRMSTHNFNITFPICDALFRTGARN